MAAATSEGVVLAEITDSLQHANHPLVALYSEFARVNMVGCVKNIVQSGNLGVRLK